MIENEQVHIRWKSGQATINVPLFFPASNADVRKLCIKVIALDFEHREVISKNLIEWLNSMAAAYGDKEKLKFLANGSVDAKTRAKEMQPQIEKQERRIETVKEYIQTLKRREKKPYMEVLKTEKEKLKGLKGHQFALIRESKNKESSFYDRQRKAKRFKENAELIEQLSAGWY